MRPNRFPFGVTTAEATSRRSQRRKSKSNQEYESSASGQRSTPGPHQKQASVPDRPGRASSSSPSNLHDSIHRVFNFIHLRDRSAQFRRIMPENSTASHLASESIVPSSSEPCCGGSILHNFSQLQRQPSSSFSDNRLLHSSKLQPTSAAIIFFTARFIIKFSSSCAESRANLQQEKNRVVDAPGTHGVVTTHS